MSEADAHTSKTGNICNQNEHTHNLTKRLHNFMVGGRHWEIQGMWKKKKKKKKNLNSMVWVRERTIPTERQPLVGKVIANIMNK
jgi:hypothetical protein